MKIPPHNTIQLLHKLISIESVTHNEKIIVDEIQSLLQNTKGTTQRINNNIVWRSPSWDPNKQTVAFGAHIDTVPFASEDWKITPPTEPKEINGKIYGRGSCDMKAGAAIILSLILNEDFGDKFNVQVFFTDREEIGAPNGVTELLQKGFFQDIDLCIVPEPTEKKVVRGIFGNIDGRYTSIGKAAHASVPQDGRNAIYQLLPVIESIQNSPLGSYQGISEALSVNTIQGGAANNVIPNKAEITFDYRHDPSKNQDELVKHFQSFETEHVKFSSLALPGLHQEVGAGSLLEDFMKNKEDEGIVPFWSDIAQIGNAGITAINYGPGSIKQAHQADEFVPVQDIEDVYSSFKKFCS